MKFLLLAICFCLPLELQASGEMEQVRLRETVHYENGDKVEVTCRSSDVCSLMIFHHGDAIHLEEKDLDGLVVLPRHLALVGASRRGWSVVEVEVGCAEYASAPPAFICIAQFEIQDGRLVSTNVTKRTFSDSTDVVPFRGGAARASEPAGHTAK